MTARTLLAAMVLLAAPTAATTLLASPPSQAGTDHPTPDHLTIVTRDDSLQRAIQAAYVQPFTAATQVHVVQQVWEGGLDTLRSQLKAPGNTWDLIMVDPDELATGCDAGLFEKLDWSAIGGKDHYAPQAASDCGLGAVVIDTALAWDKDKLPITPSWADFWDVAKYPGKRGLRKGVRGNLEIALMADGVAAGDVYRTLNSADGQDRAFRKLDQLKPYIVWWSSEAEAAKILASGDVLMTSAPSGQIATAGETGHRSFGLQFAGSLYEMESWVIAKGSAALRQAQQFLYFTGMPAIEARLLRQSGVSGLVKGLNDGLPPDLLAISPANPANQSGALRIDSGFWHDNLAKLRQRFDTWLGH
jgi:putative spermidine/putrescine transport system substrate-binding protein